MTVKKEKNNNFISNDEWFIWIYGIGIRNDRNNKDYAFLSSEDCSGIFVGTDGYPENDGYGEYLIAGGINYNFKITAIEFYGVKTQI